MKLSESLKKGYSGAKAAVSKVDTQKWGNRLANAGEAGQRISKGVMGEASINPSGFDSGVSLNPNPSMNFDFGPSNRQYGGRNHHSRHKSHRSGGSRQDIHIHIEGERRRRY